MGQAILFGRSGSGSSLLLNPLIPSMTSNTAPKGTVSASRNRSNAEPWKAFNGYVTDSEKWQIAYTQSASTSDYLVYIFASPVKRVRLWTLFSAKEVSGECNIDIIAVLDTNEEIKLSNIITYGGTNVKIYSGQCDLKNVKAFKFKPTRFTKYNQITINEFQCYGEE